MQIMEIAELDKKRMRIVLEDRSSFALYKGEARQYGLQQGEELSEELFEEICEKVLVKRARKRAMHLLQRMDRTEVQIRTKLALGLYPDDVIDSAVDYVKGYRYVDDLRYAQNYVRNHKEKKSRRKICMELLGRGISSELAQQAVEEEFQQENEEQLIRQWIEKKKYSPQTADLKEKQRMCQFLMRKGFALNDILRTLEHLT